MTIATETRKRVEVIVKAAEVNGAERIGIVGGPNSGKTTLATALAEELGWPHLETDELLKIDPRPAWSEMSLIIANEWLSGDTTMVIEGTPLARAIRKAIKLRGDHGLDLIVRIEGTFERNPPPGRVSMRKGIDTVWAEIAPKVNRLKTEVVNFESYPKG